MRLSTRDIRAGLLFAAALTAGARAQGPEPGAAVPEADTHVHVGPATRGAAGIVASEDGQALSIHVGSVRPGGPADRAGLKAQDRIVSVNGCRVRPGATLDGLLAGPGGAGTLDLGVLRAGAGTVPGSVSLLRLRLPVGDVGATPPSGWDGLSLAPVNGGLKVLSVPPDVVPPLVDDDVITRIDRQPVGDIRHAAQLLANTGGAHELTVRRAGHTVTFNAAPASRPRAAPVRAPDAPCPR